MLRVEGLVTEIASSRGVIRPVDGVSLTLQRGRARALVGESGSGKTVTALSLMRLIRPPVRITQGRIVLDGRDLVSLSEREMQRVRGAQIAMVFQDPMTFLNPVFRVGDQIMEAVLANAAMPRAATKKRTMELLAAVKIASPATVFDAYPHQLSGGMRQRVLIAMAISGDPKVIVADEPTTALDVTVQAQIMELLVTLLRERNIALLLITHDLGLVAGYCDDVSIMYSGRIVESGGILECFAAPKHPYSRALLDCSVKLDAPVDRFSFIPGQVPDLAAPPHGCRYNPRCPHAMDVCRRDVPPLIGVGTQDAACWLNEPRVMSAAEPAREQA
ncbi:MAG TPA: ABC transporter ATP-binding protein [Pseudolabrys sp.]|nr:ABC transporter ATP-binding protein [Pseudolabrys sp.]